MYAGRVIYVKSLSFWILINAVSQYRYMTRCVHSHTYRHTRTCMRTRTWWPSGPFLCDLYSGWHRLTASATIDLAYEHIVHRSVEALPYVQGMALYIRCNIKRLLYEYKLKVCTLFYIQALMRYDVNYQFKNYSCYLIKNSSYYTLFYVML